MPLEEGQVQVRDLVMGEGTLYDMQMEFNPFVRQVRADQGGPRAWNHGSWSGVEWQQEVVVPLRMIVNGANRDRASWVESNKTGTAAFAAVGDLNEVVELRFALGGTEYVMFGRPRLWEPEMTHIEFGYAYTRAAFVAQDPRIYSGTLHEESTGLPTQTGGLTVPLTVPFTIDGTLTNGRADLVNDGTTNTSVLFRIDGPVEQPWVAIQRPDGTTQQIRMGLDLSASQWLELDTAAGTALLNGLETASQRHRAAWDMDAYPLQPGTNVLRFNGSNFNETAEVTATWRSAWW